MLPKTLLAMTTALAAAFAPLPSFAEAAQNRRITIAASTPGPVISRDIFGQFAEQLGKGIYEGVWVGENSPIPNVRGIRSDVVAALKELHVPNVRWPGGCFADQYHWRNGIGPAAKRPVTYNINWGQPLESNQFGTHEYMDFIEQIGSEAYVSVNVGTGTVREAADWLEYMTTDQPTALGKERIANGRTKPFRVKFMGIGNESWGCGGPMAPETYVEELKRYSMSVRNLNPEQSGATRFAPGPAPMMRIAVGPPDKGTEYTEAVMKALKTTSFLGWQFEGLSLHHYTSGEKGEMRDPATGFGEREYGVFVDNAYVMEDLVKQNTAIMDKYDPAKKIALVVDEWGAWLQPMPGSSPLNLNQQNSMRDAIVGAIHLNIYARAADRVRMANIAQMVNVLQSMVLTDGSKMLRTPTYHVFHMYVPFQDAKLLPVTLPEGSYRPGKNGASSGMAGQLDAIAARAKDGTTWLAVTNIDPNAPSSLTIDIPGMNLRGAQGQVLTAATVDTVNTFDKPNAVSPKPIRARQQGNSIILDVPAMSVAVVKLEG